MRRRRARAALALALSLALAPRPAGAGAVDEERERIVHALNRLTFGPRPGDVERVRELGLERWIARQLDPGRIPDEGLQARLASLETLHESSGELLKGYEPSPEARREIQKLRGEMEAASEADQRALRRELREKTLAGLAGSPRQVLDELQAGKLIRAVHSERQLDEVLVDFWMNHFNVYAQKGSVRFLVNEYEQEVIRPRAWGRFEDLLVATAESPAMLFYLDNWMSVDPAAAQARAGARGQRGNRGGGYRGGGQGRGLGAGPRAGYVPPPMSRTPLPQGGASGQGNGQARRRTGLNENYARELMELHTLGVDGGYTQQDVTEVARAFTGWTIEGLRQDQPRFRFDERLHDQGDKLVLGQAVKSAGQDEGRRILHLLAIHPATARFISYKLARRFVSDQPPEALVERAAATYLRTDGNIREVLRAIVTSPEFFAPAARQAKVKTPLEFVTSAVRAAGGQVSDARDLARRLGEMGMPLYLQQPPTGYKDTAEAWVSSSGLLARLNFALDLAEGHVPGVAIDPALTAAPGNDLVALRDRLAAELTPAGLSPATLATLEHEGQAGVLVPARMAGLILGSPEFQRR